MNPEDKVIWKDFQESNVFTVTNREHIFKDKKCAYRENFEYTFNQQGNYNFKVKESPKMEITITVK